MAITTSKTAWNGRWLERGVANPTEPPPPDPPPPGGSTGGIKWGAWAQSLSGDANQRAAFMRVEAAIGKGSPAKLEILRNFQGISTGPTWPAVLEPLQGRSLVHSSRVDPIIAQNGSADAAARAFFTKARTYLNSAEATAETTVYYCINHEPEREIIGGQYTVAQFRNTWIRIVNIQRTEFPHPRLKSNLILMKYTLDAASGRNFNDYYIATHHDVVSYDVYKFTPGTTNAFMIDPCVAKAKAIGKPWAIAEFGVDPVDPTTPGGHTDAQRSAALTAAAQYMGNRSPAPEYVTYFNSDRNVPGDVHKWSIADEPVMSTAWKNGITVSP